jgi:hypothetical protein
MYGSNTIGVEVEGTVYFYPVNNIRSIEISPAPSNLPPSIVQGLRYFD